MKKVFSVVMSLVLAFCLTAAAFAAEAADPAAEAYAIITAAEKKIEGKSLDMIGDMKMTMTIGGESAEVATKLRMLILPKEDGEIDMFIQQTGELIPTIKQYYTNGWLFNDIAGVKTRQRTSLAEMEAQLSGFDEENLTAEMFKDATVTDTADGRQVKLKIPSELVTEMTASLIQNMVGDGMEFDIGDITLVYTIGEDGAIKNYQQVYDIAMVAGGQEAAASYDMLMSYHSVGVFGDIPGPGNIYDYEIAPAVPTV
jgi:hypothetical protein